MRFILKNSKFIISVALVALCIACTPDPVESSKLFLTEDQAQALIEQGTLLNLEDLKDTSSIYVSEKGNYFSDTSLYRTRATKDGKNYLFSIDTIAKREKPLYIRGRVTSDDQGGNFYKSICIQQIVDDEQQALRISVDAGSASGLYPLGQELLIRVDGLAIGRYANQPQLCLPSYNNNINANKAEEKIGWAPGRIPIAIFKEHAQCIGLPDTSKLVYDTLQIKQFTSILNLQSARKWDAKLVKIKNVRFTGKYFDTYGDPQFCNNSDPETDEYANVFAPTTKNMGYPQSRIIADSQDYKTAVSASEYAKFAHFYLPGANNEGVAHCSDYVGDIVGILGFYSDNARYDPAPDDWSITIRTLDDLQLFDDENNLWPRIEYAK